MLAGDSAFDQLLNDILVKPEVSLCPQVCISEVLAVQNLVEIVFFFRSRLLGFASLFVERDSGVLRAGRCVNAKIAKNDLALVRASLVEIENLVDAQIRLAVRIVGSVVVQQPHIDRALPAIGANDQHVVFAFLGRSSALLQCFGPGNQIRHQRGHGVNVRNNRFVFPGRSLDNRLHLAGRRVLALHIIGAHHVHHRACDVHQFRDVREFRQSP